MTIPLLDLKIQYQKLQLQVSRAFGRVLKSTQFILGPEAVKFEKDFATFCGVKDCVVVSSGTAALYLILQALDVGPGDEVITVPNSFIATAEAISLTGAKPIFVDVLEQNGLIDVDKIPGMITKKTKAIIPVHLYGQAVAMDKVLAMAKKYNLLVVEDACQAHGASYKNKRVGSFGRAAAFSFYPGKNLGAYGDAGAIITNDLRLATNVRLLRDHGSAQKYHHEILGFNFRLDALQAAVLNVKLKYLNQWNSQRQKLVANYNQLLQDLPLILPNNIDNFTNLVYHLYVVRTKLRDPLQRFLSDQRIGCGIHYPIPIHLQPAYKFLGYKVGDFPITEKLAKEILSLPLYPELTDRQQNFVINKIKEFFNKK